MSGAAGRSKQAAEAGLLEAGAPRGGNLRSNLEFNSSGGKYAGGTVNSQTYGAERHQSNNQPGLSFYRNRFYDQFTGRWTQEDPIGVAGGVNLYQFNGNNPVMFTDPFGLCTPPDSPACQFSWQGTAS